MVAGGVSMFIYRLHEIVEKQGVSGSNVCSLGGEILPIYVQYTPHLYIDIGGGDPFMFIYRLYGMAFAT
jgi:hypothetical protein